MADFLKTNYSNNTGNSYEPLPSGNYEMIINSAQETATKSGAESLQLDLLVRNDLDGVAELANTNKKYHNRHVFMDNWKRKATNQYDLDGFQYILQAVGVPEGKPLATVDDFMNLITGSAVKVYVKLQEDSYQGNKTMKNRVAPWNFEKTAYPQVQHTYKPGQGTSNPFADDGDQIDVKESDLPF